MKAFLNVSKKNYKILILLAIMGVSTVSFSGLATYYLIENESIIRSFGLNDWILFYGFTSLTMAFALTPTTFIALLSGYFLGWESIPFVCVSYFIASFIGYKLALLADHGKFLVSIKEIKGADDFFSKIGNNQKSLIVLARLSPFLPFAMMNILLAVIKTRLSYFLLYGFIGMLPRTLLFIYVGMQFQVITTLIEEGGKSSLSQISFLVLVLISLVGLYYYFRKVISSKLSD